MSKLLKVKISSNTKNGQTSYQGTVTLTGARPTKLSRKSDNSTSFTTKSAVQTAANNFAKSYGYSGIEVASNGSSSSSKKNARKTSSTAARNTSSMSNAGANISW